MRLVPTFGAAFLIALAAPSAQQPAAPAAARPGTRLATLTWPAAAERLTADAVVVLPLAAGAQQHGPHLPLGIDTTLADYLIGRLLDSSDIVVAPPLAYHHFPAFVEYPGSPSLSLNTARDLTVDVARSLASHGPRRFYVLNTGLSTTQALTESAKLLAADGILLRFTDARTLLAPAARQVQQQASGRHADELDTSMALHVDPAVVDMNVAVREYGVASDPLRLTRRQGNAGTYSPTGVFGDDATLATRDKGRTLLDALVTAIQADIEATRRAPLPAAGRSRTAPGPGAAPEGRGTPGQPPRSPDGCLAADDRAIRALGPAYSIAWMNHDAVALSDLWTAEGDMVHPDGFIERSAQVIRQNRASLFMRPEYKHSRHPVTVGRVRCITEDVAVADAKWELRGVTDDKGQPVPAADGLCTVVLAKRGGWKIEAYRYSMTPHPVAQPTLFKRPGLPGGQ